MLSLLPQIRRLQFVKLFWKWNAVPLPLVEHHFHYLTEDQTPPLIAILFRDGLLWPDATPRKHLETLQQFCSGSGS